MPRIIGIDIPAKKKLFVSLTYIYGIGRALAMEVIQKLNLNLDIRASDLTDEEIGRLNTLLQFEYVVEGDLRRRVQSNIKRLIAIHSYRGLRHRLSLPVRGQRTKTNSRTRKGKRKTVAGKKK
ncbi:MAG: 30S ribosomal protein S13 [Victivallaceae bacterium]